MKQLFKNREDILGLLVMCLLSVGAVTLRCAVYFVH